MKVKSENEVAQSFPTLSDPMDCSLTGSTVHGIFQARVLEWAAIAFSKGRCNHTFIRSNRLQVKTTIRYKEGHDILINGSVHDEDISIVNIYVILKLEHQNILFEQKKILKEK